MLAVSLLSTISCSTSLVDGGPDGASCLAQKAFVFLLSDMVMLIGCRFRAFTTDQNRRINRRFRKG